MTTEERFYEIIDAFAAANRALKRLSGDRLGCYEPEDGPAGEVAVTILAKGAVDDCVTLTRQPSGTLTQQLTSQPAWAPIVAGHPGATDTQAAAALGVELDVWTAGRATIETGLAAVARLGNTAAEPAPPAEPDLPLRIGQDRRRIAVAEARRTLPVGSRVQVFYLNRQREQTTPDVRTVSKQTSYEMVTTPDGTEKGLHLTWSGRSADRDVNGFLIVSDAAGTPFVAYRPLFADDPAPVAATLPIDPALALRSSDARRTTDAAKLDDIAMSEIAQNRRAVAENSATPAATLARLATDVDVTVRRAAAGNPNTPSATLDQLADDPDDAKKLGETKVRWRVANNPRTTEATLARMAEDPDAMVRAAIGRHPHASVAVLEHLATTPSPGRQWVDPDVRQAVASNTSTPPRVLAGWENADGHTMAQVAKNPSTPANVLERMSRDTSTGNHVRALAATNPSLPAAALYRLAHEDDAWVREHAAMNPNIDAADSHRVALDQEPKVRRALARNEHVDPEVLTRLQTDPDAWVRLALTKNPSIRPETLHALRGDGNPMVRAGAPSLSAAKLAEHHLTAPPAPHGTPGPRRT